MAYGSEKRYSACPKCQASVGIPCTNATGLPMKSPHPARKQAEERRMGRPEPGVQYNLTGAAPSIAHGNTWAESRYVPGSSRGKERGGLSHVVAAKTRTQFDSRWRAAARRGEVDGFGGVEYHRELTAWKAGDESGMSLADHTYGGYLNLPAKGRTASRSARRAGAR